MHKTTKILVNDLNCCLTCYLCKGYFIDATTIIECLHTFCRSCIVKYLESNKYCPICDVQVHKTKPLLNIRRDRTIQDLVYKLVPKLYRSEVRRRNEFYQKQSAAKPSSVEESEQSHYDYILSPEEQINVTLNYHGSTVPPRYLRCPSAVSVIHLKKLIHAKYELTERHRVDLFYNEKPLVPTWSLTDIAYIFAWNKHTEPLQLTYKIYEYQSKKPKLDCVENVDENAAGSNNFREVELRISESGEMSITGIKDANMLLEAVDAIDTFKGEIVINESKKLEAPVAVDEASTAKMETEAMQVAPVVTSQDVRLANGSSKQQLLQSVSLKEVPELRFIGKTTSNANKSGITSTSNNAKPTSSVVKATTSGKSVANQPHYYFSMGDKAQSRNAQSSNSAISNNLELNEKLNLNSELSVIPLNASANCVSRSPGSDTTTVYSTINRSMCSSKLDESNYSDLNVTVDRNAFSLKRRRDESGKTNDDGDVPPTKVHKPTILNHSIGLMNLSNNHPLKRHSKLNRNGERKPTDQKSTASTANVKTVTDAKSSFMKNLSGGFPLNRSSSPAQKNSGNVPCYMPKTKPGLLGERSGRNETSQEERSSPVVSEKSNIHSHYHAYQNNLHTTIITPSQLPHHQNLNSLHSRQSTNANNRDSPSPRPSQNNSAQSTTTADSLDKLGQTSSATISKSGDHSVEVSASFSQSSSVSNDVNKSTMASCSTPTSSQSTVSSAGLIRSKPSTPIGYKTLRDPPKSWNSQINSQIARANQNAKAQQLANASVGVPSRLGGDLKSVRPPKFFKGRNMPRYLGNPASGVKPMYQLHVSPEKEQNQEQPSNLTKSEKSEIKKHSIVKIDPKTLRPISEKAPETSNLSNVNSCGSSGSLANQELRISPIGDLKINTSSVSIFNPLKLQQSSSKNDRKSPKSPHSPKVKPSNSSSISPAATSKCPSPLNTTSPKQQRDKTNSAYIPSNPFVPNLASPTLNPNQFLYPVGGFPSYDPRLMAVCHNLWYNQRMAAAAAAGLVPSPLSPHFNLNMGLNSAVGQHEHGSGIHQQQQQQQPHVTVKSSNQTSPKKSATGAVQSTKIHTSGKKGKESSSGKSEKSLETTVEKLTQNKTKELSKQGQNENKETESSRDVKKSSPVQTSQPKTALADSNFNVEEKLSEKQDSSGEANNKTKSSTSPIDKTDSKCALNDEAIQSGQKFTDALPHNEATSPDKAKCEEESKAEQCHPKPAIQPAQPVTSENGQIAPEQSKSLPSEPTNERDTNKSPATIVSHSSEDSESTKGIENVVDSKAPEDTLHPVVVEKEIEHEHITATIEDHCKQREIDVDKQDNKTECDIVDCGTKTNDRVENKSVDVNETTQGTDIKINDDSVKEKTASADRVLEKTTIETEKKTTVNGIATEKPVVAEILEKRETEASANEVVAT